MTKKVSNILLDEVSLVDKGANPGAHFVLMKNRNDFPIESFAYTPDIKDINTWDLNLWDPIEKKETPKSIRKAMDECDKSQILKNELVGVQKKILNSWFRVNKKGREDIPDISNILDILEKSGIMFNEIMEDREVIWMLWDAISILEDSVYSIMWDDNIKDKKSKIDETTSQFQTKINKYKEVVGMDELEILQKSFDELKVQHDTLIKDHAEMLTKNENLQAELTKACDDKKKVEPVQKDNMPEDVRKKFDDLEKHGKDQADLIAKLLDEKDTVVYMEKAKEFNNIPIKEEDFSVLLKQIGGVMPEDGMKNLLSLFSTIDTFIAKSNLFKEIGSNAAGVEGGAYEQMVVQADEIRKSNPDMSKEKAFVQVMESDPELYSTYLKEQNC